MTGMRKACACLALLALQALHPPRVEAQVPAWRPDKAVELVVPSAPGGGTDKTARLIQRIWQERKIVETPVAVVNKPGGAGALSLAYLRQHAADAHYVQVVSAVLLTSHITGSSPLTYTDFTPVALLNSEYVAFAVKADSTIRSLKDLSERLQKDPASVSIAVGTSLGGVNHVAAALVARAARSDARKLRTVVFKSSAESAMAGLGGHVDVVVSSASVLLPHVKSGALRLIGVSAPRRLTGPLAGVPTLKEQGVDAVVDNFRFMIAPPGVNAAQLAYWDAAGARLAQADEWKNDLENNVLENTYMMSRDARKYLDEQYAGLKAALIDAGLAR
jgi:putative tricarboxylic transport membrane protein